jgi:predicted phosphodiesterase
MEALLYDVHGNLPALQAVLEDARAQNVSSYVLGGDYALFGGWPKETVELLNTLAPALWIRGNVDRWTGAPDQAAQEEFPQRPIAFCRAQLGRQLVADLAALPATAKRKDDLIVHASPESDMVSFLPEPSDDEPSLADVTVPRLFFGHTHLAFRREARGIELINPGSVGMPLDGDHRAAYGLLHDDGTFEHRRVAYDHERAIARLREIREPWTDVIAGRLERAAA